jgi:hypothetical protein
VPVGKLRRVNISNVLVYNADPRYGSIISGIPGHEVEDVRLSNIRIIYQGDGTKEQAAVEPPEKERDYPEPSMFGDIPAYAFFIRHAKGIKMSDIEVSFLKEDIRPPFMLNDVKGADFRAISAQHAPDVPIFVLKKVEDFKLHQCQGLPDTQRQIVEQEEF